MAKETGSSDAALKLAADFPPASDAQWMKLLEKVLAGAPFEKKLVSKTYDGLSIRPLYTRADWPSANDPSGLPGGAPFVRGGTVLASAMNGWDIRQVHGHPDPATANKEILQDLENGVTSITLRLCPEGKNGVAVNTYADLAKTLDGVMLDLAPVNLEGYPSLVFAAYLIKLLEKRGQSAAYAGNFGLDVLSVFAAKGRITSDPETARARVADLASYAAKHLPKARTYNVSSVVYHSAGASEAQELACVLASAVEYLRAMTDNGLDLEAAVKQIAFTITADADMFLSVAKIRALRKMWARVAEASGAENRTTFITAVTAPRMMSRRDPWVNILRSTVACFSAGIAGADAVTVLPFDNALGVPSDLGRRIARNTQVVLQEESGLGKVIDPAGGAWMFETLTDELADKAWSFFQEIERQGGMMKALMAEFIAAKIAGVQAERAKNLAKRKDAVTGVSEFPNVHETPVAAAKTSTPKATAASAPTLTLPETGHGKLTEAFVAAAETAQISSYLAALKGGTGASITPLPNLRLAQDFEKLRDAADSYPQRPKVYLANMGTVADFTARATFAKNFYEAGGFETVSGAGGTDTSVLAKDFKASGARFAVICSTDAVYAEHAVNAVEALKDAGASAVHLAGRGGELEAALKAAGADDFIFIGCDVLGVLNALHARVST
ncbi:MAG: methylmalonyl-CoA mutase subunit beta [Proteobacteria bacterium]|nr:methylmalonyl-CoA mutase subunit beta [Pseudomonadota bacterium]